MEIYGNNILFDSNDTPDNVVLSIPDPTTCNNDPHINCARTDENGNNLINISSPLFPPCHKDIDVDEDFLSEGKN